MNIANAPCSWGILEFGLEGETDGYRKVLDEMLSAGYEGTEFGDWGFLPTDPETLGEELSGRNLSLVGAFVPVNFKNRDDHPKGLGLALKTAKLLHRVDPDNARIVLSDENGKSPVRTRKAGRIGPEDGLSPSDWRVFSGAVERIARTVLEETGVPSVFHHHCAGYVETPSEIERLLSLTDPDIVNLCFDTGHYAYGGGNPAEGLKTFSDRIGHIHFKDWDQGLFLEAKQKEWDYFESIGNGIFCELGRGSVDFEAVLEELRKQDYTGWIVVEQDILPGMGSPGENAHRNREYLRSIGV